jgi:hypothetical protein
LLASVGLQSAHHESGQNVPVGVLFFQRLLHQKQIVACLDLSLERLMPSLARYEPNRISLDQKRHYQCLGFPNVPEGMLLPSVTTVLSSMAPVAKIMALINWRKRVGNEEANRRTRLAADRGTWMHGVIEDLFNGEDIEGHLDHREEWRPYFTAIEPFLGAD